MLLITPEDRVPLLELLKSKPGMSGLPAFVKALQSYEVNFDYYQMGVEACQYLYDIQSNKSMKFKQSSVADLTETYNAIVPAIETLIEIFEKMPAEMQAQFPELTAKPHANNLKKIIAHFAHVNIKHEKQAEFIKEDASLMVTPVLLLNKYCFQILPTELTDKEIMSLGNLSIMLNTHLEAMIKQSKTQGSDDRDAFLKLAIQAAKVVKKLEGLGITAWGVAYSKLTIQRLLSRLDCDVQPTRYTHPHLFSGKDIHDYKMPLALAKNLFFDYDDTIFLTAHFDAQATKLTPIQPHEAILPSTQALLKLIHELGYHKQFIITARHRLYECDSKTIHRYSVPTEPNTETVVKTYTFTNLSPIFPTLEKTELSHVFPRNHVIFCDFEDVTEIDANTLKRYKPLSFARSTKNYHYHHTIVAEKLVHMSCVIFDDSQLAWEQGTATAHFHHIDNQSVNKTKHIDFAIGRTFAQTLLYNQDIPLDKRKLFAGRLIRLFEQYNLNSLISPRLQSFANTPAPTFKP